MIREELIQQIYDLHTEAKNTDFGEHLISREQLEIHLAAQNGQTLNAIERFYEGLLEPESPQPSQSEKIN